MRFLKVIGFYSFLAFYWLWTISSTNSHDIYAENKWSVFLRIPRTGSTFLSESVSLNPGECNCKWTDCKCQTKSSKHNIHGVPCSEMTCIPKCKLNGCRTMWKDVPHADWLDLQSAFLRAKVSPDNIHLFTVLRNPIDRMISEFQWVSTKIPSDCEQGNKEGRRYAWDYLIPCKYTIEQFLDDASVQLRASNRQTKMLAELIAAAACVYGIELKVKPSNFTRSTTHPVITSKIEEKLKKANHLDIELYEFALKVFQQRIQQTQLSSISQLSHFYSSQSIAVSISGTAPSVNNSTSSSSLVAFGEVHSFGDDFLAERPECKFPQTASKHIGTYTWYNSMFGCTFEYDWYRSTVFRIPSLNLAFSSRTYYQAKGLKSGRYVVAFGAAQTMGIQSQYPYTAYIEHLTGLPVISIGYGGMGAGFFLDLLTREKTTRLSAVVKMLVEHAAVVIVQAMSGRFESNAHCKVTCNNMYCESGKPFESTINSLGATDRQDALSQSAVEWKRNHIELLRVCAELMKTNSAPKLLMFLYQSQLPFSQRAPSHYPQYVTEDMVNTVMSTMSSFTEKKSIVHARSNDAHRMPIGRVVSAYISYSSSMHDSPSAIPLTSSLCYATNNNLFPNCSSMNATSVCTMETLRGNCQCKALNINYYPSPNLQYLTGVKVSNVIREFSDTVTTGLSTSGNNVSNAIAQFGLFSPPRPYKLQFFSLLTKGTVSLRKRTPMVAIDSACKHHPNALIYLFVKVDSNVVIEQEFIDAFSQKGCQIRVRSFDPRIFFIGTPLEGWINANLVWMQNGQFWYSHVTDIFRLAVLWRYGGWYLDTDVVFVKSVTGLHSHNVVGREDATGHGRINNAVSGFRAQHPILEYAMGILRRTYKPNVWISAGPGVITAAVESWPYVNCQHSNCVTVFGTEAFFPFHYSENGLVALFNHTAKNPASTLAGLTKTFTLHLWNKVSSDRPIHNESLVQYAYYNNCVVCSPLH